MRRTILASFFAAALAAPANALDLDVDLGAGLGTRRGAAAGDGWSVEICRPLTDAKRVKIQVAEPGSKDRETLSWDRATSRERGAIQELPLPSRFRDLGRIWVQGSAEPKDSEVHMAVLNAGKPRRIFSFRNSEKSEVSVKDPVADFTCPES
ncbi:MAG: hypothetical protein ACREQQ_09160 [Candidatus Binatia bacterium]